MADLKSVEGSVGGEGVIVLPLAELASPKICCALCGEGQEVYSHPGMRAFPVCQECLSKLRKILGVER